VGSTLETDCAGPSIGGTFLAVIGEFAAMTKSDLISELSRRQNIPVARAESIVDAIFGSIEATLCRGERIEIRGLGSFELRSYGAYSGRNPRTGEKVEVKPKRLPFFKVGKEMKDRINGAGAAGQRPSASALAGAREALDGPDSPGGSPATPAGLSDAGLESSVGAS
jgi:integration host factor subunit beta